MAKPKSLTSRYARLMGLDKMKKIIDQNAFTAEELGEQLLIGGSQAHKFAARRLISGEWEAVWKRSQSGRAVRAYRPATKK